MISSFFLLCSVRLKFNILKRRLELKNIIDRRETSDKSLVKHFAAAHHTEEEKKKKIDTEMLSHIKNQNNNHKIKKEENRHRNKIFRK